MKQLTILDIIRSRNYSETEKKIALIKWKFNQMPIEYRKDHKEEVMRRIRELQIIQ